MTSFVGTLDQDAASTPPTGFGMSAWTPKSNKAFNARLFQERLELIKKWFNSWTKAQRWQLTEFILLTLSDDDVLYLHSLIDPLFPPPPPTPPEPVEIREDFTRILPRFLSLRIFSYLDPRTLCRAAQVCWYWRDLSQQNVLWRPKCLKYSWFLPSKDQQQSLSDPNTLWKRHYINCVLSMFWKPPLNVSPSVESPPHSSCLDSDDGKTQTLPTSAPPNPSQSLPNPTSTQLEMSRNRGLNSHLTRPYLSQPPWIHSSWYPKDLVMTSLAYKDNKQDDNTYSKKQTLKSPFCNKGSTHVQSKPFSTSGQYRSSMQSAPQHNLSSTESESADSDHVVESYEESVLSSNSVSPELVTRTMLDPMLIEKVRLQEPNPHSITLSTINNDETKERLMESMEYIEQVAPFPKLKPYYIEGGGSVLPLQGGVDKGVASLEDIGSGLPDMSNKPTSTELNNSVLRLQGGIDKGVASLQKGRASLQEGKASLHDISSASSTETNDGSRTDDSRNPPRAHKPLIALQQQFIQGTLAIPAQSPGKGTIIQPSSPARQASVAANDHIDVREWAQEDFVDASSESDIF